MTPRRSYAAALGLLVLGAVLMLLAAGRTWATAELVQTSGSTAARSLRVRGSDVSGVLPALGLLALAGVLAIVASRGPARRAIGVVLSFVGVIVIVVAATGDLGSTLDGAARTAAGVTSARATAESTSLWRWVCVLGGLLVSAAGALTIVRSASWPALGARYDRSRTPRALDAWSALDQGIDPTAEPGPPPGRMPDAAPHAPRGREEPT